MLVPSSMGVTIQKNWLHLSNFGFKKREENLLYKDVEQKAHKRQLWSCPTEYCKHIIYWCVDLN